MDDKSEILLKVRDNHYDAKFFDHHKTGTCRDWPDGDYRWDNGILEISGRTVGWVTTYPTVWKSYDKYRDKLGRDWNKALSRSNKFVIDDLVDVHQPNAIRQIFWFNFPRIKDLYNQSYEVGPNIHVRNGNIEWAWLDISQRSVGYPMFIVDPRLYSPDGYWRDSTALYMIRELMTESMEFDQIIPYREHPEEMAFLDKWNNYIRPVRNPLTDVVPTQRRMPSAKNLRGIDIHNVLARDVPMWYKL